MTNFPNFGALFLLHNPLDHPYLLDYIQKSMFPKKIYLILWLEDMNEIHSINLEIPLKIQSSSFVLCRMFVFFIAHFDLLGFRNLHVH